MRRFVDEKRREEKRQDAFITEFKNFSISLRTGLANYNYTFLLQKKSTFFVDKLSTTFIIVFLFFALLRFAPGVNIPEKDMEPR